MKVTLLTHTPGPERIVSAAARLCYSDMEVQDLLKNLTNEKVEAFIKKLNDLGHQSPLEHCTFTFAIEGVSRSLTHQLVRHRLASYSQRSQRYVNEDKFEYVTPHSISEHIEIQQMYDECMEYIQAYYEDIRDLLLLKRLEQEYGIEDYAELNGKKEYFGDTLEAYRAYIENGTEEQKKEYKSRINKHIKSANEDARYVLPNACETKIIMTMNIRSLLHYFEERCCNRAQTEHRELAWEILRICKQVSPILFENAGPSCIRGKCKEGPMCCGNPYFKVNCVLSNSADKENANA